MEAPKTMEVDEINALIPSLEKIFSRLEKLQEEIGARANELERAGAKTGSPLEINVDAIEQRQEYNQNLVQQYHKEIQKIAELGGILEDTELRIVAFNGRRGGEDVHFLWQVGQDYVQFYKSPESDYRQKKRI